MKIKIIKNRDISDYNTWPVWECAPSKFNWVYTTEEHCFIIEGEIIITYADKIVKINSGDYVIFPKGLQCYWEVIKPIRKYYTFK